MRAEVRRRAHALFGTTKEELDRQEQELIASGMARADDLLVRIRRIYEPPPVENERGSARAQPTPANQPDDPD